MLNASLAMTPKLFTMVWFGLVWLVGCWTCLVRGGSHPDFDVEKSPPCTDDSALAANTVLPVFGSTRLTET